MGMANMRIGHIEVTQPGSVPGLRSPGVGFEQPFEMLDACHDRGRRTLELMGKLQTHLQTHGCDDSARQAARDVQRYFDIAAPLHHQDEELHIFPALRERLFRQYHAREEGAARDGDAEHGRGRVGDAEGDREHRQPEQLARSGMRDIMERERDDPAPDD